MRKDNLALLSCHTNSTPVLQIFQYGLGAVVFPCAENVFFQIRESSFVRRQVASQRPFHVVDAGFEFRSGRPGGFVESNPWIRFLDVLCPQLHLVRQPQILLESVQGQPGLVFDGQVGGPMFLGRQRAVRYRRMAALLPLQIVKTRGGFLTFERARDRVPVAPYSDERQAIPEPFGQALQAVGKPVVEMAQVVALSPRFCSK